MNSALGAVTGVLAQTSVTGDALSLLMQHALAAVVFSAIGVVVFAIGIWVTARLVPFSLQKELEEDQNLAIGVIMGAMIIGISIIIAAAIQG